MGERQKMEVTLPEKESENENEEAQRVFGSRECVLYGGISSCRT